MAPRAGSVPAFVRLIVVIEPCGGALEIIHFEFVEIGVSAPHSTGAALGAAKSRNEVFDANQIEHRGEGARWNRCSQEREQGLPSL